jgi:heme A synthase
MRFGSSRGRCGSFVRCRRAIAEPGSMVLGYDEMQWARGLHYYEQSPDDALELFKWLCGNTYRLVRSLPDAAWSGTMVHSDQCVMTLNDWLDVYGRHVPEHIIQMRGVYKVWHSRE